MADSKALTIEQRRQKAENELAALKAEADVMRLERQIDMMKQAATGNLPGPVKTLSEELVRLQEDMQRVRSGEIGDSQASNILKAHALIFRGAEAAIQYQRLNKGRFPQDSDIRLIGSTPTAVPEPTT